MLTEEAELISAAEAVARTHPRAARLLRAAATPAETPDPIKLRRLVLRRIWRTYYLGLSRTAAARAISAAWADWKPGGDELPGTLDAEFGRLHRVGIGPVKLRTIIADLDAG